MRWIAHKFGGSSLADEARFRAVADLLAGQGDEAQIVVVSAVDGVTDQLVEVTRQAAAGHPGWREAVARLRTIHHDLASRLLDEMAAAHMNRLEAGLDRLLHLLEGLELLGSAPAEAVDLIAGLGEIWSGELLSDFLTEQGHAAAFLDARNVLQAHPTELHLAVDWEVSRHNVERFCSENPGNRVIATGFVCRLADGRISTLGRNGSDYSASIFAALFEAAELHIWTNVDGVLSADPGSVPQAVVLPHLSYREAFELAYFGARVIHPRTMAPATEREIPVFIRNSFRPDQPGTRIDANGSNRHLVKGITTIGDLGLINIEGAGMIGVPGTARRVFSALETANISVTMISQGSSEHSICCVVSQNQTSRARQVLADQFDRELALGQIQRISIQGPVKVLAVVGDGMAGTPGVAARLFNALGRAGVNVRAIAQGASERNISVAIDQADATRALRAVHAGFYLSPHTLSIGIIGPGHVGRALIRQIREASQSLKEKSGIDLRIRALADSRNMLLADEAMEGPDPGRDLEQQGVDTDLDKLTRHVQAEHLPHSLIVDCTASDQVAERYPDWLGAGIHVVTPSKHAGSGPLDRYQHIREQAAGGRARWRYEASVGAGLPIIQTLRDLLDTGDRIHRIEGIFSGTLAWLFNSFDGTQPFSALVREARDAGYTEPDPRDDLSGMDVARKLVILAREMGLNLELDQVEVESLVPDGLSGTCVEAFLDGLEDVDDSMAHRLAAAREKNQVLRYCGVLTADGQARVRLEALDGAHPFAHMALTDNLVSFTSDRYNANPLIVQGPGAGPDVTAAGVFADILRVAATLGARL